MSHLAGAARPARQALAHQLRLVDGAVIVCAEGVPLGTRRAMKHAPTQRIPLVVVLNKLGHAKVSITASAKLYA